MGFGKQGGKGGKSAPGQGSQWSAGPWPEDADGWSPPLNPWGSGKGKNTANGKGGYGSNGWDSQKGKGKGKDKQGQEDVDPATFTSRIKNAYQMSKSILRASLDETGGAFVKNDWAKDDADILSFANFAGALSTSNCHLLRRPGVGISEMAGCLRHGSEVLVLNSCCC